MNKLYKKHQITPQTATQWKKEFYAHLLALKLIKPSKKQELKKLVKEDNVTHKLIDVAALPVSSLKEAFNTEQGAA